MTSVNCYGISFRVTTKGDIHFLQYNKVKHCPLIISEAAKCLKNFVSKVNYVVIEALHREGLAHLDIKLENFCFDDQYSVVLIDLDCSTNIYQRWHTQPVQRLVMYV